MKKNADPPASGKTGNGSILLAGTTSVLLHHHAKRLRGLGDNGVMHPATFLPHRDEAAADEQLHVMRERRLRDLEVLQQLARAFFALLQRAENRKAVRIRKRMKTSRIPCQAVKNLPPIHREATFPSICFIR